MAIDLNGVSSNLNARVRSAAQDSPKDSAAASTSPNATAAPGTNDSVKLSSHAQQLYKTESDQSFDENKVASLRQQIAEGNYTPDYQKLAGQLIDLESRL